MQSENSKPTQLGECALLRVVTVTKAGAFLAWQNEQDLLVPISQQVAPMVEGKSYLVYLFLYPQQHVIGSSKLYKFFDERAKDMAAGDPVDLLIASRTDLGFKAVVNGTHLGLLYQDEVFQTLLPGDKVRGYIKAIRDDNKIDLGLRRQNQQSRDELTDRILNFLEKNNGTSTLTDYSPPDEIYRQYRVSKGNYKKALGALYKKRLISVSKDKIILIK